MIYPSLLKIFAYETKALIDFLPPSSVHLVVSPRYYGRSRITADLSGSDGIYRGL